MFYEKLSEVVVTQAKIIIVVGLLGLASTFYAAGDVGAELEKDKITPVLSFVDLDGDGFNDLDADDNSNGIPDKFEKKKVAAPVQVASVLGDMFNQPELVPNVANISTSREEQFGIVSFKARDISLHRIGFNCATGFGSGSGINVGSAVSGCEGGACARQ